MFKQTRLILIILVVPCVLTAASAAQSEGVPSATSPGPPTGPTSPAIVATPPMLLPSPCVVNALRVLHPHRIQMLSERLKLTQEQKNKVADILTKSEEALRPLIMKQRLAAEECVVGFTRPGLTEENVITAAEVATKAEHALLVQMIKTLFALRAALNADQVKELNDWIDQTTRIWRGGSTSSSSPGTVTPGAPTPELIPAVPLKY